MFQSTDFHCYSIDIHFFDNQNSFAHFSINFKYLSFQSGIIRAQIDPREIHKNIFYLKKIKNHLSKSIVVQKKMFLQNGLRCQVDSVSKHCKQARNYHDIAACCFVK